MSREVMQQALDTFMLINELSKGDNAVCLPGEIDDAMDALRAAIAEDAMQRLAEHERELGLDYMQRTEPEQEPCPRCSSPLFAGTVCSACRLRVFTSKQEEA